MIDEILLFLAKKVGHAGGGEPIYICIYIYIYVPGPRSGTPLSPPPQSHPGEQDQQLQQHACFVSLRIMQRLSNYELRCIFAAGPFDQMRKRLGRGRSRS